MSEPRLGDLRYQRSTHKHLGDLWQVTYHFGWQPRAGEGRRITRPDDAGLLTAPLWVLVVAWALSLGLAALLLWAMYA